MAFGARLFNGSTDKIDCGTSALLCPTTGGVTYAGWVNASALVAYDAPFGSYPGGGLGIFVRSTGKIAAYHAGHAIYDGTGSATISTGTWYHLTITYNNSTFDGFVYVNGIQDGTGNAIDALITNTFFIGYVTGGGLAPWTGSLADVGVWNTILSAGEIAALAQGARPYTIRRGSLQGSWPVDGISSPEPDLSGNVFNGTVTGTINVAGPPITLFTPRWPVRLDDQQVTTTFNYNFFDSISKKTEMIGV